MGLLGVNAAQAALVTYTASAGGFTYNTASSDFLTALGAENDHISFAGATNNDGTSYSTDVTFSTKAGAFGGSDTGLVNASSGEIGPYGSWDGILNIDFLANGYTVSGVGFGLVEFNSSVESIRIYNEANILTATFNNQLSDIFSFWGIVADAGERIGRIELDGNFFAIQDIYYAENSVSAVPVPAAVWLFGSGLVGLLGFNRKRSQSSAT
ncbi:VPLPA-CTERM sorting domain-containing protein [Methylobacter sp. YRD-M1]|uniref:VPLPA-CTERM sorting domain-containing protein n=1 Tax=Methylobacter sp. YRD-M1 TaxID=2911520 RepID=UPI00227AA058|nr:VPLPA-CTERM sorting domain-containing protein [Methylobacter sp. YRD-M1]WAK00849.1 VPLPA-CTERM sorting domain-containing protein [Methylobacter sp. YRD-M1]